MLLILGRLLKNKMAAIKLLKMYAMDTPLEPDIFRIVSPKRPMLLIFGHLLKSRWPPSTFYQLCTVKGNRCL